MVNSLIYGYIYEYKWVFYKIFKHRIKVIFFKNYNMIYYNRNNSYTRIKSYYLIQIINVLWLAT